MTQHLQTSRLTLYPWRDTDLEDYARLLADPSVVRHITHEYGPLSHEEAVSAHERILRLWNELGFGAFAAVERESDRWAGKIGLDHLDRWPGSDKIEVEWQLNSAFWGRGYATEGARAVIHWAFSALRLARLIAITVPYHTASRRVMEKCGLSYQGNVAVTDRRLHAPRDVVWYAIDRTAWLSVKQPLSVPDALLTCPNVRSVRLAGSRAPGRAIEESDWDFIVQVDDFPAVARDLHRLVQALEPIAQQWDRQSDEACYMLTLRGPVKVDLIFAGVPHHSENAWTVGPDSLPSIDGHFWDWILWLTTKQARGRNDIVRTELVKMWEHLLRPPGVPQAPSTLEQATSTYLSARADWERRFGISVSRELEEAVLPRVPRR